MTESEAINLHIGENLHRISTIEEFLRTNSDADDEKCKKNIMVLSKVNGALQEIQKYRAIGTVEECRFFKGISEKDISTSCIDLKMINELREYKKIGTVEECREARERQRTKKPINLEYVMDDYSWMGECPFCGAYVSENKKYCLMCGQHLDWSKS